MTHDLFQKRTKEIPYYVIKNKAEGVDQKTEQVGRKTLIAYHGQTCGQKVKVAVKMGIQEM